MEVPQNEFHFDPTCECDAPTYVDFTDLAGQYDDNADEWFDMRAEEQKPVVFDSESQPEDEDTSSSPQKIGKLQSAANTLAQMIANGTGSISKLKPRVLPQKAKEEPKKLKLDNSKTPASKRKVKPFVFECDKRAALRAASKPVDSSNNSSQGHIPAAEFVAKFQKKTPPRFRRTPQNGKAKDQQPEKKGQRDIVTHMTIPKTPNLRTVARVRPRTVKSAKEIEDEMVATMKQNQFKAKAFNRKLIDKGGLYGVPRKREVHLPTEPCTPDFASKNLKKSRRDVEENSAADFRAKPMPDFSRVKGIPPKRQHHLTEPESPAIAKRPRIDEDAEERRQKEREQREFKANKNYSSVLYGKPFIPEKSRKPLLQVDNFVLHSDLRSQERSKFDSQRRQRSYLQEMENLQRKALREAEEAKEIAEYRKTLVHKAQPIAPPAPVIIKSSAMPTVPISPNFATDRVLRNRQHH